MSQLQAMPATFASKWIDAPAQRRPWHALWRRLAGAVATRRTARLEDRGTAQLSSHMLKDIGVVANEWPYTPALGHDRSLWLS